MEEITRRFTVQAKTGESLNLIEYSFPMDMSKNSRPKVIHICRYTTDDKETVEKAEGGYRVLGETLVYYE